MDEYNIQKALDNVCAYSGVQTSLNTFDNDQGWYATLCGIKFTVLYRNSITTQNISKIDKQVSELKKKFCLPVLVVTMSVSVNVMDILFKHGISIAETSGNCRISNGEIFITVSGKKKLSNIRSQQTYTNTKLKVIFYFLLDKENVSYPFRNISQKTGVSLSVIKQTVDDLIDKKFVILTPKGRIVKNRKGLIELWSLHYNQVMKPKLLLAKYDFASVGDATNWKNIVLPEGMMWGGEPADSLIGGFLKPEIFDVYSEGAATKLLSTGNFKPNPDGIVSVYSKFWMGDNTSLVPDVLIYADLMSVGNSRCEEAAHRLLNNINNW